MWTVKLLSLLSIKIIESRSARQNNKYLHTRESITIERLKMQTGWSCNKYLFGFSSKGKSPLFLFSVTYTSCDRDILIFSDSKSFLVFFPGRVVIILTFFSFSTGMF